MSHVLGTVFDNEDKEIAYFEYDGTSDLAIPRLYLTKEEVWASWRSWPDSSCVCGQKSTPAFFHANYGDGIEWEGTICLNPKCMHITSNLDPYEYFYNNNYLA